MNPSDNKLVVNPRDELIQEMLALREQKIKLKQEAKLQRHAEYLEWTKGRKKETYEWAFRMLVKKYFKLEVSDLKNLDLQKFDDLEKLIYDLSYKKWRTQRIFLYIFTFGLALFFPILSEFEQSYPTYQLVRMHKWYEKNFGSVVMAILN